VSTPPEPLPAELADALDAVRHRLGLLGSRVLYFRSIGSTNDVATALAAAGAAEGFVVVAAQQTAGRGRRGRTWFSPPLGGLYVSVVLAPARSAAPARAAALVTLAAGVALAEAVETVAGLRPDIKWPNDLFVGRRKLAGILAEGSGMDAVVLGYGINVGPMVYPPELADRATSLELELGRSIDDASLCAESLAALAARYDDLLHGRFDAILDAWRLRAPGARGARVAVETSSGTTNGITAGIDDAGALLVQIGDRVERIVAGEVTWMWR
jgi:BirA family biotin operon repressor/biotin-[acetyl-CoA-carboxylase] ligase